tara:strand:+ start:417 stop:3485 length:3069 start_codon:yes stop_codon:yes gene_type:complete
MPSPDKLFRLDPVETKITAPVSQFQSLADAADRSVANRSLGRGLTAFSQALGGLAQYKKQEQIRDDIKTAKDAAVRGEVMPNVLPVAETAYRNVIDINTASDSLLAIDRFENGEDFGNLVRNPELQSDQKTSQIEASYDDFYARAVQTMQNPDTIQKLRLTVNGLKEKAYQKVYEHEKTVRNIEGIHGLKNTLGNAKRFAEGSGVELIDTLTPNWVQANAVDLGKSHPYLGIDERKLLAFQVLTTDEDVIGDPEIIEEIMKSNYSKGFTFRNLYEGKGDDAKELQDIYNTYVKNSKAYFKKLDDDQEAADIINTDQVNADMWKQTVGAGLTSADGVAEKMVASGYFTVEKANKHEKAIQSYMNNNLKAKRNSAEYMQVLDLIQAQGVTLPSQIQSLMIKGAIDPSLETELKTYLTEEGKQKLAFIGKYQSQIRLLSNNVLSLSKLKLSDKGKNILSNIGDRDATPAEMMRIIDGTGLDPKQVELIIQQVQDLQNGMQQLAENYGSRDSIADKADGSVPQENLEKFQSIMEANVNKLIADIDKGLEERPGTREVNLPSLEFPVISTGDEFPLVVNQTKNIFDNLSRTGADISPASGSITFDVEESFMQNQNMTMRSYLLDATTKNWPKPFSDMVVAIIEQEKKDKVAEPDTPLKQAIRRKQETLDNIGNWFSDVGEDIGMVPGFIKELLTPGLDMKTGKKVEPVSAEERVKRKQETLDNIDTAIVDSGKNLLNLMQSLTDTKQDLNKDNETPNETIDKPSSPTVGVPAGKVVEPAATSTSAVLTEEKDQANLEFLEGKVSEMKRENSTIRSLGTVILKGANSILEAITGDVEGAEVPDMPLVKGPLSKAALFGANHYNASPGTEERTTWATNADRGIKSYRNNALTKQEQFNVTQMLTTLSKAKSSFVDDLRVVGLTFDQFKELMVGVYSAETSFGLSASKVSKTNVVGELQVTRGTFRDVSKPRGNFGPLMAKAVGFKSIQEIRNLSDKELKDKLLNDNKFNYIAGAAVMLNKLQTANKKFK